MISWESRGCSAPFHSKGVGELDEEKNLYIGFLVHHEFNGFERTTEPLY